MLTALNLRAGYGATEVLRGIALDVAPGEIVAVLGRNGSGRSTLARALMGLVPARGELRWKERSLLGLGAHQVARLGLAYVPESRDAFVGLSVEQNLLLGLKPGAPVQLLEEAYALFAALHGRRRTQAQLLSGGEQQMLSLARALMGQPELLIVDEPTEGLAPQLVETVAQALAALRGRGVGVLLIEQKLAIALRLADRVLLMGRGEVVFSGAPAELQSQQALRQEWLES